MSFDTHIIELYKKAMGTLLFLKRVKNKFEPDTRKMVVQALVISVYKLLSTCLWHNQQHTAAPCAKTTKLCSKNLCWWSPEK